MSCTRQSVTSAPVSKRVWPCALFVSVWISLSVSPAEAGLREWLQTPKGKERQTVALDKMPPVSARAGSSGTALPEFFKNAVTSAEQPTEDGAVRSDLRTAVEARWSAARAALQAPARSIGARAGSRKLGEIAAKLFTLDTQLSRESLKTGITTYEQLRTGVGQLLVMTRQLSQSIAAPQEETLAKIDQTIGQIHQGFGALAVQTRAGLAATEGLASLVGETAQTIELIPALKVGAVDVLLGASKQLMGQIKAENEATRGMLLNVQTAAEQGRTGLAQMRTTIQQTLRFSDHFAYKQYPLVNLPVPAREKIFAQTTQVDSALKSIGNVLKLADAHLRNAAERHQQVMQTAADKMTETLRYQQPIDESAKDLPQMLAYAHNQIYGLFLRGKEAVTTLRSTVARAQRATEPILKEQGNGAGQMAAAARRDAVRDRLPLFLLGANPAPARSAAPMLSAKSPQSLESPGGEVQTLYAEADAKPEGDVVATGKEFRPDEMDILTSEAGELAPLLDDLRQPSSIARAPARKPAVANNAAAGLAISSPVTSDEPRITFPDDEQDNTATPMARIAPPEENDAEVEMLKVQDWGTED